MMDPWEALGSSHCSDSPRSLHSASLPSHSHQHFDDQFVEFSEKKSGSNVIYEKLPDSEEYLALLERKLSKLTKSSSQQSTESKKVRASLLEDLSRAKEDALANFVTSCDIACSEADVLEERVVTSNPVVRRLVPEQAVTVGERAALVSRDSCEPSTNSSQSPQ